MQYRDIDKQALKENGYRVLSKITIVGTNTIFTEDDHIVNWDYEDYRYVPDNGFIGQFVERIFDGNLQDISEDVILEDTEINLQLGIVNALDNNTTTWYDYGNFLVTKVEKTDTTGNYKFESADYTKKFNKVFDGDYTDTTYTKSFNKKIEDKETVTALWLAQYACAQADVELADNEFTNSDFVISSNQYDSDDTLRKVMQDIGKLAYSWVRVGEDNEVHIDFTPKEISEIDQYDELTTDEYYVSKKSDLTFGPVNKVLIGMSDVEGENMYETSPDYTEETGCAIKIYDNNLTNTDELRALALQGCDKLFGLTYTPIEINSVGHPWLDGDELIKLTNVDDEVIYTYPFNRKLTYAGYIESIIGAEASTSQNSKYEYKSDIISDVRKTSIIVDKQNQTITALVQNVDDVNSEMSFEKTASGNPIEIEDGGNYQLEDFKLYGNTSHVTAEYEEGLEVEDTSISVDDVDTSKDDFITLKGNTEQETTQTGKNVASIDSVSTGGLSRTGDLITLASGSSASHFVWFDSYVFKANTSYSLSIFMNGSPTNTNTISFLLRDTNNNSFITLSTTNSSVSGTFTPTSDATLYRLHIYANPNSPTTSDVSFRIQIEQGQPTSYEPYIPNSPSPDYPQPINITTGLQEVEICGKNLFISEWEQGEVNNTTGQNTASNNVVRTKDYIPVIPNQHYAINRDITTSYMNVRCYDTNKNYLGTGTNYIDIINGQSAGNPMGAGMSSCVISPKADVYYLKFNDLSNNLTTKYMMTKGDTQQTYEPYIGQSYEVNLGKNLYNKNGDLAYPTNAYVDATSLLPDGTIKTTANSGSNTSKGYRLSLEKNTNYVVSGNLISSTGNLSNIARVRIMGYSTTWVEIKGQYLRATGDFSFTFNSGDYSDYFISLNAYGSSGGSYEAIYDNIQLELGTQATPYSPYFEPIELCKIGTYQDKIYKENGKWYLHKEIGKVVLNGSEDWQLNTSAELTNTNYFSSNAIDSLVSLTILNGYSNNFIISTSSIWSVDNETIQLLGGTTNTRKIRLRINKTLGNSLADFKTWLSTHNTILYYILANPTNTKITNTELINQLDELYTAQIFETTNINVGTSNMLPYINLKYNLIATKPTPENPQEIQNVTSETTTTEYEAADFGITCYDEEHFTELGTFEFKGDTYQETTTQSANFCPPFNDSKFWTYNGGATANSDGSMTIPTNTGIGTPTGKVIVKWDKSRNLYVRYKKITSGKSYFNTTYMKNDGTTLGGNGAAENSDTGTIVYKPFGGTSQYGDMLVQADYIIIQFMYNATYAPDEFSIKDLIVSSSNIDYIPFVPDSPSPDYPSEVQVVTGKQDVLFDRTTSLIGGTTNRQSGEELYEKMVEHAPLRVEKIEDGDVTAIGFYNNSFLPTGSNPFNIYDYWKENMQYTIRAMVRSTSSSANSLMLQVVYTDGVVDEIGVSGDEYTELRLVTDPDKTISRVGFACEENDESYYLLDISSWFVGEEDSHYYPEHDGDIYKLNLGANSIELCKIGDYRDKIFSIGNLFKVQQTYYPPHECTYNLVNNGYEIIPVPEAEDSAIGVNVMGLDKYKGIELTCSFDVEMDGAYHYYAVLLQSTGGDNYDEVEGVASTETGRKSFTFTLPVDSSATRFLLEFSAALDEDNYVFKPISYSNIKIGVGSEYSEETDWYLHKEIGKVVLDGSTYNITGWGYNNRGTILVSDMQPVAYTTQNSYLSHFTFDTSVYRDAQDNVGYCSRNNNSGIMLRFSSTSEINTQAKANTWLGTNLPTLYYVLANPTNTKITNADLLEQLNGINTLKLSDVYNEYRTVSDNLPMLSCFDVYKTYYKIITLRDNSYNVSRYNLLLKDMELCKIGDYRDYIHYSNDNWYLHRNIDKIVLDGSENWQVSGTGTDNYYYYYFLESITPISNDAYSTYFISTVIDETNTNEGIYVTEHYIRIRYGEERTVTEFKEWLQTHIMPVYYPTNNSEDVAIVEPKVIEGLNKIKQMYLYTGYNKLYLDDDLVDLMEITYLTYSDFNGKYATKAELQITNESITTTVSKTTESLNDLGQRIEQLDESISEQTALSITDWFNTNLKTVIEDLENSADTTSGEIKNIKAYIRRGKITDTTSPYYGQAYIELGDDTNQTTLRILQNRIQFLTNGQETAYISNNQLYINESTILTKEKIGHWVTTENEDGSLDTYWEA